MDRQQDSSVGTSTKVSLFFVSPATSQDEETTIGLYVCTVPDHQLVEFMDQVEEAGGKLKEEFPGQLRYDFNRPDSLLTVDRLATPYMLSPH